MTANLKALVQKWRDEASKANSFGVEGADLIATCADELAREIERMESEHRAQEGIRRVCKVDGMYCVRQECDLACQEDAGD